jgi:hypothetical protein
MALSEQDLQIMLQILPDITAVEKALDVINKRVEEASKKGYFQEVQKGFAAGGFGGAALAATVGAPAAAATAAAGTLGFVSKGLESLDQVTGPVGAAIDGLGKGLALINPAAGLAVKAIGDITDTLVGFMAKASPGTMVLLNNAVDDVMAAIGREFIPIVMDYVIPAIRWMGDVLMEMIDGIKVLFADLKPLWDAVVEGFQIVFSVVRAGVQILFRIVEPIFKGLIWLLTQLQRAWNAVWGFFRDLLFAAGGKPEEMERDRTVGAAARPSRLENILAYQSRLQTAAYGMGVATKSPLERIAQSSEELNKYVSGGKLAYDVGAEVTGNLPGPKDPHGTEKAANPEEWTSGTGTFPEGPKMDLYYSPI